MSETLSVRDLTDGTIEKITAKAQAAGLSREAWLRKQIEALATGPIVKERYAIRFYANDTPAHGLIRRMCGDVGGIGGGPDRLNPAQMRTYERAKELILRNGPGDREEAIYLLRSHFDNVFEVPV